MRVLRPVFVGTALALCSGLARAQGATIDPQCRAITPVERAAQDACQKAIDLFTYLAPQLAGGLTGGNAVLGEASGRGAGRFSAGLRVNVVRGRLPDAEAITPSITGAVASDYAVTEQLIPVPTVDAALGVFSGVLIGGTRALGLDALFNVTYIPEVAEGEVAVTLPDGSVKVGLGARVTIVEESVVSPGISVTWLQRSLPRIDIAATPGVDRLAVDDLLAKTTAWRAVIGKGFGPVALTAGFGQDDYEISALAQVQVVRQGVSYGAGPIGVVQRVQRDNAFGSVALRLPMFSIVGEYGRIGGGRLPTYNTFSGTRADDALEYGSLGIRLRF